jgi:hypothetical protein
MRRGQRRLGCAPAHSRQSLLDGHEDAEIGADVCSMLAKLDLPETADHHRRVPAVLTFLETR